MLGPGGGGPGTGGTGAAGETAPETGAAGDYRPYPDIFRETVLPRIFRDTVLPSLAGQERDEAVEILSHLEPAADGPAPDATA